MDPIKIHNFHADDDDVMATCMRIIFRCSFYIYQNPMGEKFAFRQCDINGGTNRVANIFCTQQNSIKIKAAHSISQRTHLDKTSTHTAEHLSTLVSCNFFPFLPLFLYVTSCFYGKSTGIIKQRCGI
jgi:hypothetical protein